MIKSIIFAGALLVTVAAELPAQSTAWLTHYQRGERHMAQGEFQEAALSFLRAIREKGVDNERERLSGTRTIAYYPRRELGIALIRLGIVDFAEEELRTSIRQSPSERAERALQDIRR